MGKVPVEELIKFIRESGPDQSKCTHNTWIEEWRAKPKVERIGWTCFHCGFKVRDKI